MVAEIEKTAKPGTCLVCQCDLGFFRKLTKHRFCIDQHEQQYMAELKEVALGRLQSAGSRLTRHNKARVRISSGARAIKGKQGPRGRLQKLRSDRNEIHARIEPPQLKVPLFAERRQHLGLLLGGNISQTT